MPSWKIDPPQVRAVLDQVQPELEALNTATNVERLSELLTAVAACNNLIPTDCVEAAMTMLMQDQMTQVGSIGNSLTAGVVGVSTAVAAYQQGDAEMATEADRQMRATATSGDFTWFLENPVETPSQNDTPPSYIPGGRS